jgi:hypothetical protein
MLLIWAPHLIESIMRGGTAMRLVSLSLLLLSAAPLASLYALFINMDLQGSNFFPEWEPPVEGSLASALSNPNTTLEELWTALFQERWNPATGVGGTGPPSDAHIQQIHHWTVVVPWAISLVLGVLLPCVLSVVTYLQARELVDDANGYSRKRRKCRITKSIQPYRKVSPALSTNAIVAA